MGKSERESLAELSLPPGFRFFPTDEELMVQYLCRKASGHHFSLNIIAEIDIYKFDPWILPSKALFGEKEWYFFSPRDRKYPNGSRPNRVAGSGYWKATGTDKVITTQGRKVGIKKALVFYVGKAPKGTKTNWIMHEYRLTEPTRKHGSSKLDDWVLCRIYKKNSGGSKPELTNDQSRGPSCDSSASHLDDVMDTLAEIDDRPRTSSLKAQENNNNNNPLQQFESGFIDWAALAGLTQPESNTMPYDMYVSSLPALAHMEVQSAIRTQRVNSVFYNNSDMFGLNYSESIDPFGVSYRNQSQSSGFGFGQ